jgi:hypothetical protein
VEEAGRRESNPWHAGSGCIGGGQAAGPALGGGGGEGCNFRRVHKAGAAPSEGEMPCRACDESPDADNPARVRFISFYLGASTR